jgi:diguanylate cyclase (GGDEF)-like protein
MLDIDYFKNINDTYGHLIGDQVLQTIAFICRKNLRSIDLLGRYGGEEFVIMLPETPLTRPIGSDIATKNLTPLPAQIVAERLRKTVAQETLEIGEYSIKITISLGVAEYQLPDFSIETVIDHADQALLKAKSGGRNNVVIWDTEEKIA